MSDDKKKHQLEHTQSDTFLSLYTNNADVHISIFDLRIDFRQVLTGADGKLVIERMASVVMSPQHAKALVGLLTKKLEQYEEQFGPITLKTAGG